MSALFLPSSAPSGLRTGRILFRVLALGVLAAAVGLISGCGSAAKTTLPASWSVQTGEASMIYVEPNREDLIIAEEKDIAVLAGKSGQRVYGEREKLSFRGMLRDAVSVGSLSLSDFSAEGFSFAFLDRQGLVLVFDYNESEDVIRAIDLESGDERWSQSGYRWSLQKYEAAGGKLAMAALRNVGIGAAVATEAVAAEMTRQRYTQQLVAPVPGQDAMLLKTVGALKMVDLSTGEEMWSIDGVEGSSLVHTHTLPDGDILLLVNYSTFLEGLSGAKKLMRLDPASGEMRWDATYRTGVDDLRDVRTTDSHVLLVHIDGELEAYDLATGDRTLRTSTGWGLMGPNYLTAVPLVEDGIVYAARGRTNATGRPDVAVRAYDLASGDELWTSDPLERFDDLRDLVRVGDLIIGRATNSGGSDGVVRSSLWGPDAYHRVAAWHIRDGSLAWSQKLGGGQTSTAVVDRQFDSYQRPAQLALVPADDRLYTVSDTALVALARTDGTPVDAAALPTETLKEPLLLLNRGARLGVLHDRGMSFYQASNLGAGPTSTVAFENGVVSYQQAGLYLFAATQNTLRESKKGIYVITLDAQRLVGSVNLESTTRRAGNLLNGYTVTEGGRSIYVIDESGTVTKYRVD